MDYLNWELSTLSRAVGYGNLSGAAANIGVSQPQLSRIVSRLEAELGLVLLDRATKRNSAWTPQAYRLAELYSKTFRTFQTEMQKLAESAAASHFRIGTLEGLMDLAIRFSQVIQQRPVVRVIELDVSDLNRLEEKFFAHELDFIFTFRQPGKKNFKNSRILGYQTLERSGTNPKIRVMSSFEYATQMHGMEELEGSKILVSNSLAIRKRWTSKPGGVGHLPSEVRREREGSPGELPCILIGSDDLPSALWRELTATFRAGS